MHHGGQWFHSDMSCIFQIYGFCLICKLTLTDKLKNILNLHVVSGNLLKSFNLHNEPTFHIPTGTSEHACSLLYMPKAAGYAE